ncbi:DoxX family protein [Kordiimonas sp. SCSIO 12610]|uniref:DoxX family protein n=1 Tax=Kordiimonas sp. SCSIO 12610 TaxID=2829597 RepID=UPI00210C7E60|nr:DoxX family protein [Kordiimonas sp. SCSIO 12610]UTW54168.1 DoxX family protein [Kordiimonas sp. SCSIO 12610]
MLFIKKIIDLLEGLPGKSFLALLGARLAVAHPFYVSGRSKAASTDPFSGEYFDLGSFTVTLFESEYSVPVLSPETAATLALYGETFLPIMLALGLGGRFAAAGLLVMTIVINISYSGHDMLSNIAWVFALLAVLTMGPGKASFDHIIRQKIYGDK